MNHMMVFTVEKEQIFKTNDRLEMKTVYIENISGRKARL